MSGDEFLGRESIGKLLFKFAMPMTVSLVLSAVYNMVDQIFIGQGVGYIGNSATNVIFPLMQLTLAFGFMFGDGAASYMNLCMGEGNYDSAKKTLAAGIVSAIISGVILSVLLPLFMVKLCGIFGATEKIMPYALDYGYIICGATFIGLFDAVTMNLIRADGSPGFAMLGLVAGCVTNLIGDPIAIFYLNLGVKGAAWATVLGQAVNAVMNIWYFNGHTKSVKLDKAAFKDCFKFINKISRLGFSSFVGQIGFVIVLFVQNNLLVTYGALSKYGAEIPMAALGVTMKFFTVLFVAVIGVSAGAQPIFSYNYGAKKYDRVIKTLKLVIISAFIILISATLWFQLAPNSIIKLFGSGNELYNEFSRKCLRIFLSLIIFDACELAGSTFFQSIGKPVQASALIMTRQIILQVPLMYLFCKFYGVEGLLYAGPVDSFTVGTMAMILLWIEIKKMRKAER
ncbi:MAG: MATE family efflux transporter [Synergistaceae bacterium]|nr:MATE family efflux transporter [Synergistaceae bacterium]MBQ4419692.1 MATE family efflux transporter [Synergistaceae bacterium]MBR0044187.1 MATE family efflux transporter [Synergistaceae bacterium]MBR0221885.1 MATE family efflux transporter [Synergistaceae bacterium]